MKIGISKLGAVWGFLRGNLGKIGVGVSIIGAAYFGAANHHLFDRVENLLFHSQNPYETYSHSGSLEVIDKENNQGKLEKMLKNSESGDNLYTIAPDALPARNQLIYERMFERADNADKKQLEEMYENTKQLLEVIKENKYKDIPVDPRSVNPNRVRIIERTNNLGELCVYLKSGTRETPLTTEKLKDFFGTDDNLAKEYSPKIPENTNYTQASLETQKESEKKKEDESSGLMWYLAGFGGLAATALRMYKVSKS